VTESKVVPVKYIYAVNKYKKQDWGRIPHMAARWRRMVVSMLRPLKSLGNASWIQNWMCHRTIVVTVRLLLEPEATAGRPASSQLFPCFRRLGPPKCILLHIILSKAQGSVIPNTGNFPHLLKTLVNAMMAPHSVLNSVGWTSTW
jgi:hypothetical protein